MDPNETLRNLLKALLAEDRESALESIDALGNWLDKDGFFPDVDGVVLSLPGKLTERDKQRIREAKTPNGIILY